MSTTITNQRLQPRITRSLAAAVASLTVIGLSACGGDDTTEADAIVIEPEATDSQSTESNPTDESTSDSSTTDTSTDTTGDTPSDAGGNVASTTTPAGQGSSGAVIAYPVTAEYAGLTWSIEGVTFATEGEGDDVTTTMLVDLTVRNDNPFGLRGPLGVLSLQRPDGTRLDVDGQVGTGSMSVEVEALDAVRTTLEFEVEEELDPAELTLSIAETDKIPATSPFVGEPSPTEPYPIELGFDGTTKPLPLDYTSSEALEQRSLNNVATVAAVSATAAIDAPGMRANNGDRLLVVDVRMDAPATNTVGVHIVEEHFRLDIDGVLMEPSALFEEVDNSSSMIPAVEPASSEPVTLVFEIPADLSDADVALVLVADEDYDSDRIPITIGELPPLSGE